MIVQRKSTLSLFIAPIGIWFIAVVAASRLGWLGSMSPYAIPPVAGLLMLLPALAFWSVAPFRDRVERYGLRRLTALHVLRMAAVPLFFWYGGRGLLPKAFVNHAGWGDLISGLLALVVVVFWSRPAGYWLAHIVGMADFLYAFATAMMLTRANPGAMHAVTGLPMALIPFFGVGLLGSTHLMAYSLLLRGRTATAETRTLGAEQSEVA